MPQIALIDDPDQVATLVDLIGQARKVDVAPPSAAQLYVLVFHLHDGTVVQRVHNFASGRLGADLYLPEQFHTILREIIFPTSPTPPIAP